MKKCIMTLATMLCCGLCLIGCGSDEPEESTVDKVLNELGPTATSTPTPRPESGVTSTNIKGVGDRHYDVDADISLQLEEYDEESETSKVVSDNRIQCGKQYILRLIGDGVKDRDGFDDWGSVEFEMELILTFGANDADKRMFQYAVNFYEEAGKLSFKPSEDVEGEYRARFDLSKEKNLDLSKGYFKFCLDEVMDVSADKFSMIMEIQPILAEDTGDEVDVQIHGVETQRTDFKLKKGDYEFDADNITYGIGAEVEKTTMYVEVPEKSEGIEILFFSDKERKTSYGEGTTGVLYPEAGESKLTVVIAKYMKEYVGKDRYEELRKENKTVYLRIKSLGGNSYNDVMIDVDYTLD